MASAAQLSRRRRAWETQKRIWDAQAAKSKAAATSPRLSRVGAIETCATMKPLAVWHISSVCLHPMKIQIATQRRQQPVRLLVAVEMVSDSDVMQPKPVSAPVTSEADCESTTANDHHGTHCRRSAKAQTETFPTRDRTASFFPASSLSCQPGRWGSLTHPVCLPDLTGSAMT
jgi:hypothetical protein